MSLLISTAHAASGPAQQADGTMSLILMVGMVAIFYFMLIRPQQKRAKEHQQLVAALSKGDEVVTSGGVLGKVTKLTDDFVVIEAGNNIQLRVQRSSVLSTLPKGTIKEIDAQN